MGPPRLAQSIPLPRSGGHQPGPIHTIVSGPAGEVYYSDEINHSVCSLDGSGEIRWQRTARGNAAGRLSLSPRLVHRLG